MVTIAEDFNLRAFNTLRIDVKCSKWIEYTLASDLPGIMAELSGTKFMNIGAGSNLLFVKDFDGAILHSRILDFEMQPFEADSVLIRAGAGIEMDALIERVCLAGLWGLENLSGIPGDVGSSAVQNIGAYGVEAADVIHGVECYDTQTNTFVTLSKDDCQYAYRDSLFKRAEYHNRYIVSAVSYIVTSKYSPKIGYGGLKDLSPEQTATPMDIRNAVIEIRNRKLPAVEEIGSAGSFFKNPVVSEDVFKSVEQIVEQEEGDADTVPHYRVDGGIKIPAAWLIDRSGLKGISIGGAAVWHNQPLVIVNATGHASISDILELEHKVISTVAHHYGILLEPEVEHIY